MDGGAHAAAVSGGSSEAGGASSSSASSASSYGVSESRFRLNKGVHLRRRRRRLADRGSNKGSAGDGVVQELALPLGMSFAAVLAQVSGVLGLFLLLFARRPKDSILTILVRTAVLLVRAIFGWALD